MAINQFLNKEIIINPILKKQKLYKTVCLLVIIV